MFLFIVLKYLRCDILNNYRYCVPCELWASQHPVSTCLAIGIRFGDNHENIGARPKLPRHRNIHYTPT